MPSTVAVNSNTLPDLVFLSFVLTLVPPGRLVLKTLLASIAVPRMAIVILCDSRGRIID